MQDSKNSTTHIERLAEYAEGMADDLIGSKEDAVRELALLTGTFQVQVEPDSDILPASGDPAERALAVLAERIADSPAGVAAAHRLGAIAAKQEAYRYFLQERRPRTSSGAPQEAIPDCQKRPRVATSMTKAGRADVQTNSDGQAVGEIKTDVGSDSAESSTPPAAIGRASTADARPPGEAGPASASRDAAPG